MKTYKEFISEALVTFGGKAYPKYGHVVILAGGSASGKGFVIKNLLGIEAKVSDVDALKELALKTTNIKDKLEKVTGKKDFDFKNPEDVRTIHLALSNIIGVIPNFQATLNRSLQSKSVETLPNMIFDVTLSKFNKFQNITDTLELIGYKKENIHLVWVINSIDTAIKQNASRSRTVPEDILIDSHVGASKTLKQIVNLADDIADYMNGDIWFVFNDHTKGDTTIKNNYIEKAEYIKIKKSGSSTISQIPQKFLDKIKHYTEQDFNDK